MPPGDLLAVLAAGFAFLLRGWRRTGLALTAAGILAFYLLSTTAVSCLLMRAVEAPPTSEATLAASGAQAIVVLSAGFELYAPEYSPGAVDGVTLQRLRYGAHLARLLNLPVLVSGGQPDDAPVSLAALMKAALEQDFGIPVRWTEEHSTTTYENAVLSAPLLKADGVQTIILVTHAAHMVRSARVFAATGLKVVPAPTVFSPPGSVDMTSHLSALHDSYYALYEIFGAVWYALRH
ncbi:MAG: YdcF family protein [Rhodospirillaceae bacterium]